jgi:hypothetical protein
MLRSPKWRSPVPDLTAARSVRCAGAATCFACAASKSANASCTSTSPRSSRRQASADEQFSTMLDRDAAVGLTLVAPGRAGIPMSGRRGCAIRWSGAQMTSGRAAVSNSSACAWVDTEVVGLCDISIPVAVIDDRSARSAQTWLSPQSWLSLIAPNRTSLIASCAVFQKACGRSDVDSPRQSARSDRNPTCARRRWPLSNRGPRPLVLRGPG